MNESKRKWNITDWLRSKISEYILLLLLFAVFLMTQILPIALRQHTHITKTIFFLQLFDVSNPPSDSISVLLWTKLKQKKNKILVNSKWTFSHVNMQEWIDSLFIIKIKYVKHVYASLYDEINCTLLTLKFKSRENNK